MPKRRTRPNFVKVRDDQSNMEDTLRAVILVQSELKNPGSDKWHQVSDFKESLFRKIRRKWCEITKSNEEDFPFSEDYVAHRLYTAYRKTSLEVDNEITAYLGLPRNLAKEERARNRAERKANK